MRIKRGKTKRKRHNKILKMAKGYRLTYSKLYRRAKEAVLHAGQYSFNDRKKRKGQFRRTWIQRIQAGLHKHNLSYNKFIFKLKSKKIDLNRKSLAYLAKDHPEIFDEIVKEVKQEIL